ncbi:MAG: hypothetical protein ACXVEF_11930 [Polyangiales bacterium]
MRRTLLMILSVSALVAAPACKKLKTGAAEKFGTKYSCPDDRIHVTPRTDLKASDVMVSKHAKKPKKPPAEVQADPARLAKWKADQEEQESSTKDFHDNAYDVFEVEGCDHHVMMTCHHPSGTKGGTRMDRVSCDDYPIEEK